MDTLKLLSAFLKVNIQMSLAYRADTVVNILLNIMWLGWELLSLEHYLQQHRNHRRLGLWRIDRPARCVPSCPHIDDRAHLAQH